MPRWLTAWCHVNMWAMPQVIRSAAGLLAPLLTFTLVLASPADDVPKASPAKNAKLPALPRQIDLRPQFAKFGLGPRGQGGRNTCSVFVTTGALTRAAWRSWRGMLSA